MAMNVQFLRGLSSTFKAEGFSPVSTTFYFLTDTSELYLGSVLLSNEITAVQFAALEARVKALEDADFQSQIDGIKEELKSFGTSETITKLEERIKAIEDWKAALPEYVEKSVYDAHLTTQSEKDAAQDKALTDYKAEMVEALAGKETAGAAAQALADAKEYSDGKLAAVVEQYLTGEGAADTIDTLNEIAEWLNSDTAGVSQIIKDVAANTANISTVSGDLDKVEAKLNGIADGDGTVKAAIDAAKEAAVSEAGTAADGKISAAIAAENLGQYAKSADIAGSLAKAESAVQEADLAPYAKTADIEGSLAKAESALQAADLADYAKTADVNSAIATATTDMATNASVDSKLEPYAKSADVANDIATATTDMATNAGVATALEPYAKSADVTTEISEAVATKVDNDTYAAHLTAQSEKDAAQDQAIAGKLEASVHTEYVAANDARVGAVEAKFEGTNVTMLEAVTAINQLYDGQTTTDGTIKTIDKNLAAVEEQLTWGSF